MWRSLPAGRWTTPRSRPRSSTACAPRALTTRACGCTGSPASPATRRLARPGTPAGPEGARQVFSRLWAGCSDMHFDLQEMVAEGNKVVCIGVMTGTHDGPFHGIPATHRSTAARHIHVLTFDETGLITEHLAVRDDVTVFRQLGALPAACAAVAR